MAANEAAEMTAGREMDAAVHKAVFKEEIPSAKWEWDKLERDENNLIWAHPVLPHYSTDIGAAWLVVEKMRANGYAFDAGSWENMDDGNNWVAEFEHCSALVSVRGLGATMMEAICKAALACRAALVAVKGEGDGK